MTVVEVGRVLLEHGADVRAGCLNGVQPLHYTAWMGAVAMARLLLEHGADINAVDASVKATPLAWAHFQRRPRLAALLRERGARR